MRCTGHIVQLYVQRGALKRLESIAHATDNATELARIAREVQELDVQIGAATAELDKQAVCAFITFERQDVRRYCGARRLLDARRLTACLSQSVMHVLSDYPNRWLARYFMSQHAQFQGHKIRVRPAPEASNILYHNLHFTW